MRERDERSAAYNAIEGCERSPKTEGESYCCCSGVQHSQDERGNWYHFFRSWSLSIFPVDEYMYVCVEMHKSLKLASALQTTARF